MNTVSKTQLLYSLILSINLIFISIASAEEEEKGWYFGAGIGSGEVEVTGHDRSELVRDLFNKGGISLNSAGGGEDDDTDTFHFTIGYQFNDYIAFEGSYYDLGDTDGSFTAELASDSSTISGSLDSEYEAASFSLVGQYPLFKRFYLTARGGLHYWRHEASLKGSNATASIDEDDDDTGTDLLYGVGAKIVLCSSVDLLVNWDRFDGIEDDDGIDVKSISLIYKF